MEEDFDRADICSLCYEIYGVKARPRTLPCGHTHCSDCLEQLIRNRILNCPQCQRKLKVSDVTEFPINYGLEHMIEKCNKAGTDTVKKPNSSQKVDVKGEIFAEQKLIAQNLLQSAEELKIQTEEYDKFLADNIERNQRASQKMQDLALRHSSIAESMREERKKLEKMLDESSICTQGLKDCMKDMDSVLSSEKSGCGALVKVACECEHLDNSIGKLEKEFPSGEIINSLKGTLATMELTEAIDAHDRENSSSTSLGDNGLTIMGKIKHHLGSHMDTVSKLKDKVEYWKKFAVKHLVAIETKDGRHRSATISTEGDRVYLHHLEERQMQPPSLYTIEHSELILRCVKPEATLTFLDLSWDGSFKGRLHILLSPDTPLARQFRTLCTGDLGPSYARTKIFGIRKKSLAERFFRAVFGYRQREWICGGDYQNNNGSGGAAVMGGINPDAVEYKRPSVWGAVWTNAKYNNGQNGQFFISTECGTDEQCHGIFGEVQEDFGVLQSVVKRLKDGHNDVEVVDCGVVLDL